ncbi:helix-turn-helix domain-containing protein [Enterococcus gallinarum]|uniref:helix-turn-helix domain-containing protein n=1 Tax=Enterococcus gallinarum TaxID=1353 RepID=UPI001AD60895|nr:helix-turn-helix transcriptional regulator [Enterococcus gallinarum]MBO6419911.1 XRE family transcriptional regulator [Enterococcus gallinarum]MBO6423569.1 XRE family transcriptional regulator [Enterococcus gallinarum]MCO5478504.1 helix-turn-helix domain-containing protein [Enterococcus gallinarum]MCR1931646.1 helix-turn-helix domain-containing protein [Enterococcus gallinarum]
MSENLDLKIRMELRKRRMTFKELAEIVGISSAYMSDIINGKRNGDKAKEHIKTIKGILNIT